jgi:hypothetical protein
MLWKGCRMETKNLSPEIKWKTTLSLFLNYITTVHKVLADACEDQNKYNALINKLTAEFWREQAQAFIDLFGLKKGNLKDAHTLKRLMATLLDIGYMNISESDEEIVDSIDLKLCPIRTILSPVWPNICGFCGPWGQIVIDQLDPSFKHEVVTSSTICKHRTTSKRSD